MAVSCVVTSAVCHTFFSFSFLSSHLLSPSTVQNSITNSKKNTNVWCFARLQPNYWNTLWNRSFLTVLWRCGRAVFNCTIRHLVVVVTNCFFFSTGWWPLFCFIAYRSTTKAWECCDAISDLTFLSSPNCTTSLFLSLEFCRVQPRPVAKRFCRISRTRNSGQRKRDLWANISRLPG